MSHPYMPLYVADYLSATSHLNAAESGAYLHLLMHYWQKGELPQEDKFLARIARMSLKQWLSAKPTIKAFFNDDWTHARAKKELDKASAKAEARAIFGAMGGRAKALKNKEANLAKASDLPEQAASKEPSKPLPSSSGLGLIEEGAKAPSNARAEKAASMAQAFERFWSLYPEKVGKKPAALAFAKVASEIDAIIEGLQHYIREKPPDRSWLNPATFLNQRRWEDQRAPNPGVTSGRPASGFKSNGQLLRDAFGKQEEWLRSRNGDEIRPEAPRLLSIGGPVRPADVPSRDDRNDGGIPRVSSG